MRTSIPLKHAYKLINHGPTTLITTALEGRANVMPAAWITALDVEPARVCAVISKDSFTRELIEKTGEFAINLPAVPMALQVYLAGKANGRDRDKIREAGFHTAKASQIGAPLVEGCVGWLECRVCDEPKVREEYDLVIADVLAAWADDEVFEAGEWHFERNPARRTLHHISKGVFLAAGERIEVKTT